MVLWDFISKRSAALFTLFYSCSHGAFQSGWNILLRSFFEANCVTYGLHFETPTTFLP